MKDKELYGVKIARIAHVVSHLLFANDSILFCKASVDCCRKVNQILHIYEEASGQQINKDKSSVFFNMNVSDD